MSTTTGRIAVVVVHGMGNQYPMETLRGFVNAMRPPDAVFYSSPNRITNDLELRRLSFSRTPFDYYEYYWAHHVEEPPIGEVLSWSFKLLFLKTPSNSLKKHIGFVRRAILIFALLLVAGVAGGYLLFKDYLKNWLAVSIFGASILVLAKLVWTLLSNSIAGVIQSSIGDVIKYTVPSPKNIHVREKIRKGGIELLRNLHDAKTPANEPKYQQVVVVAHSLGTVVAYDMLTSLFAQYHGAYTNVPAAFNQKNPEEPINQPMLQKLFESYHQPNHTGNSYQTDQALLFDEYRQLGNQWRVSHFITLGSPLTHASVILSKGEEDFKRKKDQREFPVSPPQLDHADNHFSFNATFVSTTGAPVSIKMLHHAAHFAATQWTNIYFENDWIGGNLAMEFGKGIVDIPVIASNKWLRRVPLSTHTRYWDEKNNDAHKILKAIIDKIHETSEKKQAGSSSISKAG
jgi:hypothetical protein